MRNYVRTFGLVLICLMLKHAVAQEKLPISSLCDLQEKVARGEHRTVKVKGVYSAGKENQSLTYPDCSNRSTRVEFALKSRRLWNKLVRESNSSSQVQVIFTGEFYGPPVPDPKLPPAVSKHYHPGWDYNSTTKLVVHTIQSVEAMPRDRK